MKYIYIYIAKFENINHLIVESKRLSISNKCIIDYYSTLFNSESISFNSHVLFFVNHIDQGYIIHI